ncbi:Bifunctional epoxide hydrolase 2 [Glycine soja]|uniref:Bifunctional epoxide hydrolase 2 n=1 Tax=Glycine soja TaxID=3848 RepID=A0A445F9I6_GLYSO|nr:Bifunctional epoxide hydrolase 2 [Glycine soja]
MHFAEKGEGPVVLFLHGFPDLWYCWRNQILNLSELGYHAVAPDLRGYGDTQVLGHDHDKASRYTVLELDYIFNGGFKQDVPSLEEVKVLPGVGHFSIAAEAADRVNTEIYNFIHKFPN